MSADTHTDTHTAINVLQLVSPTGNIPVLGLWLRLECSLDCIIYVSEGFDVPRDYRSRRGRETIKRYDVTETYSHVVRQNLSETSITCAESC